MFRLFLHEMRARRNGIIGWGIGLALLPMMYVGLYPEFAEQMEGMQSLLELPIYQAMGMSMATFEAYVASTTTNMIAVILTIYSVINGTGTLAGEEEDGRLELIVALPVPRWQIVTVKAAAMGVALFLILLIASAGAAATLMKIESQVDTVVSPFDLAIALLSAWPIVAAFGMISLFLGAFTPRRRFASIIAAVIIIVSYFGNNLAGMIESLEAVQPFFLFNYFDATETGIIDGQAAGDVMVLTAVMLISFALAIFFFQRRNITVGAWPWAKAKIA